MKINTHMLMHAKLENLLRLARFCNLPTEGLNRAQIAECLSIRFEQQALLDSLLELAGLTKSYE